MATPAPAVQMQLRFGGVTQPTDETLVSSYGSYKQVSWTFKELIREAQAVLPAMSMRQFARVSVLMARAYAVELGVGAPGQAMSLEQIMNVTPSKSTLARWQGQ